MSYIDGFVIAVPTANKQKFIEHAQLGDSVFIDLGATRVVECWGDEVPEGRVTSMPLAVQLRPGEVVCFSWVEYPDRETRDRCRAAAQKDPRLDHAPEDQSFDGTRLIWGGFTAIVEA